jgi:hypothetical protein
MSSKMREVSLRHVIVLVAISCYTCVQQSFGELISHRCVTTWAWMLQDI